MGILAFAALIADASQELAPTTNWPAIIASVAAGISAIFAGLAMLISRASNSVNLDISIEPTPQAARVIVTNRGPAPTTRFTFTVATVGFTAALGGPEHNLGPGESMFKDINHAPARTGVHIEITWASPHGRTRTKYRWYQMVGEWWDPLNLQMDQIIGGRLQKLAFPRRHIARRAPKLYRLPRATKARQREALIAAEEQNRQQHNESMKHVSEWSSQATGRNPDS